MPARRWLASFVAVLLAAGLSWLLFDDGASVERSPSGPGEGAAAGIREKRREATPPQPTREAEAPVALSEARPQERTGEESPHDSTARVVGRFVDLARRGVEGVRLVDRRGDLLGVSEETGRFELALAMTRVFWRIQLRSQARGYATVLREVELQAGETLDLGEIELSAECTVEGCVTDDSGGPVPGAWVRVTHEEILEEEVRERGEMVALSSGETDADGRFRVDRVPAGRLRVWAGSADRVPGCTESLLLSPGDRVEGMAIVLEPLVEDAVFDVFVVDPEGRPVPFASVFVSTSTGSLRTSADAQGHYRHLVKAAGPYTFRAADYRRRHRDAILRDVTPGSGPVELRLGAKQTFRLEGKDQGQRPVCEFVATLHSVPEDYRLGSPVSGPFRDGVADLPLPIESFRVAVEAEGYAVALLGPFDPDDVPPVVSALLQEVPLVRGVVVAGGQGIAGAEVTLHEAFDRERLVNGFPARSRPQVAASATAAEHGEFELTVAEAGAYYLRARAPGFAPADVGPLDLDPQAGHEGIRIELSRGGSLEGRVLLPPGMPVAEQLVALSRGDGFGFTFRCQEDGSFWQTGLTPGPWSIEWRDQEIPTNGWISEDRSRESLESLLIHEGRTTRYDLDLRELFARAVEGRLTLSGAAPGTWSVRLLERGREVVRPVQLRPDGRFFLPVGRAGAFVLEFLHRDRQAVLFLRQDVQLGKEMLTWTRDIPVGELAGRIDAAGAASRFTYSWRDAGASLAAIVYPTEDGSFSVPMLPAGSGQCAVKTADGGTLHRDVVVREGETATVFLP